MTARIHPAALVDPSAVLADDVVVGPGATVEADVTVGEGSVLMQGAILLRDTHLGPRNVVHPYAVLGGAPQDVSFDAARRTELRIGAGNVFREGVTVNRGSKSPATILGDRGYYMTGAHVGHDCRVADDVIVANGAALAGHVEVGAGTFISAHVVIHQFCWVGERVMFQGNSGLGQHAPPYTIIAGVNQVAGLNVVGLRRAGISPAHRAQVQQAYRLLYRSGLPARKALEEMDRQTWGEVAVRFREFVRRVLEAPRPYNRGLPAARSAAGDEHDD